MRFINISWGLGMLFMLHNMQPVAAGARIPTYNSRSTFKYEAPAVPYVQRITEPKSSLAEISAPVPLDQRYSVAQQPLPTRPAQHAAAAAAAAAVATAAQHTPSDSHMRTAAPAYDHATLSAPSTSAGALAAAAAVPSSSSFIPYAPSIPYNPNSLYKPLSASITQGSVDTSVVPQSHPVGIAQPSLPPPADRQRGIAGLISAGAQAVSTVAKLLQHGTSSPQGAAASVYNDGQLWEDDAGLQAGNRNTHGIVSTASASPMQGAHVGVASSAAVNTRYPGPLWGGQQQQRFAGAVPALLHGSTLTPAVPGYQSQQQQQKQQQQQQKQQQQQQLISTAALRPQNSQGGVLSALPGGASYEQHVTVASVGPKPELGTAAAAAQPSMPQTSAGMQGPASTSWTAPAVAVSAQVSAQHPASLPVRSAGDVRVGKVSVAAAPPAATTQRLTATQAKPATSAEVATAAVGSFSSTPAVAPLSQSPHQPQATPAHSTGHVMHVAPSAVANSRGFRTGPTIDDLSDAVGAPVASVTWKLPEKVHVGFAPAAHLMSPGAPLNAFDMPPSMRASSSSVQVSSGGVSHYLTPTWVPAS